MWRRRRCVECGGRDELIPYAKRGWQLVYVCCRCYHDLEFFNFFFKRLKYRLADPGFTANFEIFS